MEYLTVTCIKPFRGFLEIYGHKRPDLLAQLTDEIAAYQPFTKKATVEPTLHPNLDFDTVYLVLNPSQKTYHRCVVREKRSNNKAMVELIDFGIDFEVDASLLLELDPKNKKGEFLKIFPPIATKYILAQFFCAWKFNERSIIEALLVKSRLPITNEQMDREHNYISLTFENVDVARKFINSHLGMEISFTEQRLEVRKLTQRNYDGFSSDSTVNGAGSPAKREKRRNLVANRPLQGPTNNNVITHHGKQLIHNHIGTKTYRGSYQQDSYQTARYSNPMEVHGSSNSSVSGQKPTFTANELAPNLFHVVYCPYVENGPNEFYVQLKSQEHTLDHLAVDLANAPRVELASKMPINMSCIGMACIARYSEDKSFYRAVIQKVHSNACRVIFVDYGHSELVPISDLYEIPPNFLEPKIFAMPFELHGWEQLNPIDDRLKKIFDGLVKDSSLELQVIPGRKSAVQQCVLYLPNGLNVLEVLKEKRNETHTFPNPPQLKDGDKVYIRSVVNAKKLYVQRVKDITAYDQMMDALLGYCVASPQMMTLPKIGKCCAAMYAGNAAEFYRVIVDEIVDHEHVKVHLVDFGVNITCHLSQLRSIDADFLELPRQVNECCLADFANISDVPETTRGQIELLIEDSEKQPIAYRVTLRNQLPNGIYVVELINEQKNDLHVSLSVYNLSMPRRYSKAPAMKVANEVEKPPRAAAVNRNNNWQNDRECDGAENQERFQEMSNDRQKERFGNRGPNDDGSRYERTKQSKPRNENSKQTTNGSGKNYQNRSDYDSRDSRDNRRTGDVNKNDNWDSSMATNSSSSRSTDSPSKADKINNNNSSNKSSIITSEEFVGFNAILPDTIPVPLNSSAKVMLVYWKSPFEFHVQLKSMDDKCIEMMQQIQTYYKKRAPIQKKIPIDSLVLARFKEDRMIKRAKVIDYNASKDKYRVQFIDFGATAVCQLADMYEMEKSFTRLPAMAINCTFQGVDMKKSAAEVNEKVDQLIGSGDNIECRFIDKDGDTFVVDMMIGGTNLKELLIREQFLAIQKATPQVSKQPQQKEIIDVPSETTESMKSTTDVAYIVHVDSPNLFYMQLNSEGDDLDAFQESLQTIAPQLPPLTDFREGELCISKYSSDDRWYRAKIIHSDGEMTTIQFIDYGNTDTICNKAMLKSITNSFAKREPFAMVCSLPIRPHSSFVHWAEDACEKLRLLSFETALQFELLNKDNDVNYVKLFEPVAQRDLAQELIQEKLANPLAAPITTDTQQPASEISYEPISPEVTELPQQKDADQRDNNEVTVEESHISNETFETIKSLPPPLAESSVSLTSSEPTVICNESTITDDKNVAYITHVDSPNRFYIQLNSEGSALDAFQESLQIVAPQLPALTNFRAGQLCIGKYSLDDQWYRAKIVDSDGEITSIQFIDYGNTDSITDKSLLKSIDDTLANREPFAMACSLPIVPCDSSEWTENACEKLRSLSFETPLQFQLVSKDNDVNYVKLFEPVAQRDLVKELIHEKYADPLEIIKSGETCFVSHVNSLNEFFIQVDSDTEVLRKIESYLEQNSDSPVLESPEIGTICSAKFEDGQFYRARILAVSAEPKLFEVEFLDYGNIFQTEEVLALSPEISQLPYLRKRCSLKLPEDIQDWSQSAEEKFREIADSGATEFTVQLIKPGKTACVELYMEGQNLSVILSELCEKRLTPQVQIDDHDDVQREAQPHSSNFNHFPSGKQECGVSHINSPADFYIQFISKTEDLNGIQDALSKLDEQLLDHNDISIGSIVAALFPDDGYFYRAKVLEKTADGIEVLFIDFGNSCIVTEIRQLSSILNAIVPLASNCSLAKDRLTQFTPYDTERFMSFLEEDPQPTFQVEAIGEVTAKTTVNLYRDGKEILDFIREMDIVASTVVSDIINEAVTTA